MIVNVLVLVVLLFGYSESETDENPASPKWGEFPNVVTLHRLSKKNEILPFCMGYVMDKNIVITAAHCVADSNGKLNITGVFVLYKTNDTGNFVTQRVSSGVIHWKYNPIELLYDIALISINGSFPEHMNHVRIAIKKEFFGRRSLGCQAIAWDIRQPKNSKEYFKINEVNNIGVLTSGKYKCNGRCNQIIIRMITFDVYECILYRNNLADLITDGEYFCANRQYLKNCERLSGAVIMCSGFLYGLFSSRNLCNITTPNVVTGITYFENWLKMSKRYFYNSVTQPPKIIRKFAEPAEQNVTQAVALFRLSGTEFMPYCGGGIINRRLILTAAHCVVNNKGNIDVDGLFIMSSYKEFRFNPVDGRSGVVIHPDFNWQTKANNIALVRIYGEFHPGISPAILPLDDDVTSDVNPHWDCSIMGWGFKNFSDMEYYFKYNYKSDTFIIKADKVDYSKHSLLAKAEVSIISKDWPRGDDINIETNGSQFWSIGDIQNTCQGESGDIFFCNNTVSYGIVSHGVKCWEVRGPVTYTRIGYYNQWIIETMKKLEKDK